MAEIPRSFFEGRAPAAERVTGGIPSVPGTARLQGSELVAEQGVRLGQQAAGIGAKLFDVARQQEAEREAIESTRGVASGLIEIEAISARIQNDPSIFPTDRADAFRKQAEALIAQTTKGLGSDRVKAQVQLQLGRQVAAKFGAISQFGQREFKAESEASRKFLFEQGRRQLLESDTPEEREAVLGTLRGLGAQFVESGAATQGEISRSLVEVAEGAEVDRLRLIIASEPRRAERHLIDLAKGGTGVEGFPDVPLDQARALLAEARQVRRQTVQDDLTNEKILDKREDDRQALAAIELRSGLFEEGATVDSLRDVVRITNDAAAAGLINQASHSSILNTAKTLINAEVRGGVASDPEHLNTLTFSVYGEALPPGAYVDLRAEIESAINTGAITRKEGVPLLKEVDQRSRADHYSKVPEYKEGVNFIRQAVGFSDTGLVLSFDNPTREIKSRGARALVAYNDAINEIFQQGGRDAVAQSSDQIADRVVESFGVSPEAKLATFPVPPSLRGLEDFGTPFERYIEAQRRLAATPGMPASLKAAEKRLLEKRLELEEAAAAKSLRSQARRAAKQVTSGFGLVDAVKERFNRAFTPEPVSGRDESSPGEL